MLSPSELLGRWAVPLSGAEGTLGALERGGSTWPCGWGRSSSRAGPLELPLEQSLWLEPRMEARVVYPRVSPQPQCSLVGPSESMVVCVEISLQW